MCNVDNSALAIYRDTKRDGRPWQRIAELKLPGDAEVHPDGSAAFQVPARVPLYFQALAAHGYAVQTMRIWNTLQPGETFSCVGCHEGKPQAPVTGKA